MTQAHAATTITMTANSCRENSQEDSNKSKEKFPAVFYGSEKGLSISLHQPISPVISLTLYL